MGCERSRSRRALQTQLKATLELFDSVGTVIVVKGSPDPSRAAVAAGAVADGVGAFPRQVHDDWQREANRIIDLAARGSRALVSDPTEAFCDEKECRLGRPGEAGEEAQSFYADNNHVSALGSELIWARMEEGVLRGVAR